MITGFVFDLDGVITDTARYHYQAWAKTARDCLNIVINPQVNELLKGRSRIDSLKAILRFGGAEGKYSEEDLLDVASRKNDLYKKLIQNMTSADILPGISDFLKSIQASKVPIAVASASRNAPTIIESLGLSNVLNHIVDPTSIEHGKPAPDIFMAAAELIHSDKKSTVAFEDAAAGIEGINSAGMFSVGIGDPRILGEADVVVRSTGFLSLAKITRDFEKVNLR